MDVDVTLLGKDGNARATLGKSNAPVVPSISPGICSLDHPYFLPGATHPPPAPRAPCQFT